PRRGGEGLPDRRSVGPRRASYGGERCRDRRGDPGRPAPQGPDRLGSCRGTGDDAGGRGAHRHHAVLPRRGRRPGGEPRPASGAGETTVTGALRIDGGELPSTDGVRAPHTRLITLGRF